jgi:hypothetical protein
MTRGMKMVSNTSAAKETARLAEGARVVKSRRRDPTIGNNPRSRSS